MISFQEVAEWAKSLVPDLDARVEVFRVDTEFMDDELIEVFKEEIAKQSALMKAGAGNDNLEDIRSAAHSIKGMGGTIGLPEISVLAHEIELLAKKNDISACKALVAEFVVWATDFSES
ncbi:Hpt domain-containing protein [Verrucomicrobiota bacterium]